MAGIARKYHGNEYNTEIDATYTTLIKTTQGQFLNELSQKASRYPA